MDGSIGMGSAVVVVFGGKVISDVKTEVDPVVVSIVDQMGSSSSKLPLI